MLADNTDVPGRRRRPCASATTARSPPARVLGGGATAASTGLALAELGARTRRRCWSAPRSGRRRRWRRCGATLAAPASRSARSSDDPVVGRGRGLDDPGRRPRTPAWWPGARGAPVVFEVVYDPWPTPLAAAAAAAAPAGCWWAAWTCWCTRRRSSSSCSPAGRAPAGRDAPRRASEALGRGDGRPGERPRAGRGRRGCVAGAAAGAGCVPRLRPVPEPARGPSRGRPGSSADAAAGRTAPRSPRSPTPPSPRAGPALAALARRVAGAGRAGAGLGLALLSCCRWCRSGSRWPSSTGGPGCCPTWLIAAAVRRARRCVVVAARAAIDRDRDDLVRAGVGLAGRGGHVLLAALVGPLARAGLRRRPARGAPRRCPRLARLGPAGGRRLRRLPVFGLSGLLLALVGATGRAAQGVPVRPVHAGGRAGRGARGGAAAGALS